MDEERAQSRQLNKNSEPYPGPAHAARETSPVLSPALSEVEGIAKGFATPEENSYRVDLLALLGFSLLTLLMTYPLSLQLAEALQDTSDSLLNLWITNWQAHQLLTSPLQLFDTNIFYPYPNTLAYSEILFPNVLLSVPIFAFTDNPILTYNLMFLLSFILSAFSLYLLAYRLSGNRYAAFIAGLVFAFSPYRAGHLSQLQLLTMQWMPLALLYLDRYLGRRRAKDGLLFCAFFVAQCLSSFYYAFYTGLAVGLYLLYYFVLRWKIPLSLDNFQVPANRGRMVQLCYSLFAIRHWKTILRLALLGGLIAVLLTPFALPYFQVNRDLSMERTLSELVAFSPRLRTLLKGYLLPSLAALVLALLGFFPPERGQSPSSVPARGGFAIRHSLSRRGNAVFYLILAFFGLAMALGPTLRISKSLEWPAFPMPYRLFFDYFPGFKAMRAPGRLFSLTTLGLGVLAALGIANLEKTLVPLVHRLSFAIRFRYSLFAIRYWIMRVGIFLLVLYPLLLRSWAHVEVAFIERGEHLPPVYRWLARQPPTVVVELPLAFRMADPPAVEPVDPSQVWPTYNLFRYQYFSTYHWQESIDGYSGFVPPRHGEIDWEMEHFPSERAISLLQGLDVEYVVLHESLYRAYQPERWPEVQETLPAFEELTLVKRLGQDYVYQVQPRAQTGDALAVKGLLPPQAVPGEDYTAYLLIANSGPRSWVVKPTEKVSVMATWRAGNGQSTSQRVALEMPLVTSGASVVPVSLPSPAIPGEYRLLLVSQCNATAGPLPSFSLEGPVSVNEGAERAAEPVPVRLYDYSLDRDRYVPGDILRLTLHWEALGRLVEDYSVSVKLLDVNGTVLAQQDSGPQKGQHPTSRWWPGERIADQHELNIPSDTSLGQYQLQVSLYRPADLSRLLTLDEEAMPVQEPLSIWVKVKPSLEPGQLSIQHPLQVNLGDQVTLLGYDVSPDAVQPGQSLDLTLYWQARREVTEDYTVFTHLVAADGRIVAQQDNQPAEGRYPTFIWDAGEIVVDRYRLTIAPDAPGGEYHLEVGMYLLSTLERLKIVSGDEEGQDRIWLGQVFEGSLDAP